MGNGIKFILWLLIRYLIIVNGKLQNWRNFAGSEWVIPHEIPRDRKLCGIGFSSYRADTTRVLAVLWHHHVHSRTYSWTPAPRLLFVGIEHKSIPSTAPPLSPAPTVPPPPQPHRPPMHPIGIALPFRGAVGDGQREVDCGMGLPTWGCGYCVYSLVNRANHFIAASPQLLSALHSPVLLNTEDLATNEPQFCYFSPSVLENLKLKLKLCTKNPISRLKMQKCQTPWTAISN